MLAIYNPYMSLYALYVLYVVMCPCTSENICQERCCNFHQRFLGFPHPEAKSSLYDPSDYHTEGTSPHLSGATEPFLFRSLVSRSFSAKHLSNMNVMNVRDKLAETGEINVLSFGNRCL